MGDLISFPPVPRVEATDSVSRVGRPAGQTAALSSVVSSGRTGGRAAFEPNLEVLPLQPNSEMEFFIKSMIALMSFRS